MELSNTHRHGTNPTKLIIAALATILVSTVVIFAIWSIFGGEQSTVSVPSAPVSQPPAQKTNEPVPTADYVGTYKLNFASGGNSSNNAKIVLNKDGKIEGYAYNKLVYTGTYRVEDSEPYDKIYVDIDGYTGPEEGPGTINGNVITDSEGSQFVKQ